MQKQCTIPDCGKPYFAQQLCSQHYSRLRRHGSVEGRSVAERFWSKVEFTDTCWLWAAGKGNRGYGQWCPGPINRNVPAHRWAYEFCVGPIPEGLTIDHLCRVTSCVNPEHLEPVTAVENVMRGNSPAATNARKTHCKRGHSLTPDNLYADKKGQRICRTCKLGDLRKRRAAQKVAH